MPEFPCAPSVRRDFSCCGTFLRAVCETQPLAAPPPSRALDLSRLARPILVTFVYVAGKDTPANAMSATPAVRCSAVRGIGSDRGCWGHA